MTRLFSAALVGMVQDRTDLPSMMTVHAPHCPRPHPNRGPCNPRLSRNTYKSGVVESASTIRAFPFTLSEICAMGFLSQRTPRSKKWRRLHILPGNPLSRMFLVQYYTRPGSDRKSDQRVSGGQ